MSDLEKTAPEPSLWRRIWSAPEPEISTAGFGGELLVAGVRLLIVVALLYFPIDAVLQSWGVSEWLPPPPPPDHGARRADPGARPLLLPPLGAELDRLRQRHPRHQPGERPARRLPGARPAGGGDQQPGPVPDLFPG